MSPRNQSVCRCFSHGFGSYLISDSPVADGAEEAYLQSLANTFYKKRHLICQNYKRRHLIGQA
ncbi:hypothetical protein [Oscillatoria acuminata]|uniref:hypothetical protein n=1 Tax=Oscillatoria acuminata TaxID=118323 RepID=UPI0002DB1AD5|nr:hypothetical protein [Oscillatoria acuminata]